MAPGTPRAAHRKDPVTFIVNSLCVLVTVWTISQLSWGESFFEKRRRVIRERIRQDLRVSGGGWSGTAAAQEVDALSSGPHEGVKGGSFQS